MEKQEKFYYFFGLGDEGKGIGWELMTKEERDRTANLTDFERTDERNSSNIQISEVGVPENFVKVTNEIAEINGYYYGELWRAMSNVCCVDEINQEWIAEHFLKDFGMFKLYVAVGTSNLSAEQEIQSAKFFSEAFSKMLNLDINYKRDLERAIEFLDSIYGDEMEIVRD